MKGRFQIPTLFFYGLTALMIVCTIVSFVSALSWINRPFAGFLVYDFPYTGSMGSRDWPGTKAGLKFLERIVAVDDQPVWEGRDVVSIVKDRKPGSLVKYTIESKGVIRKVTVPVAVFSMKDFSLVFLIPFLGGLALYALGVIVYLLKPNTSSSWVFFVLCFSLGTYMVTGFEMQSSYFFVHLHYIIIPLFPATFFHLGLIFPDRKDLLNRFPLLEYIIYVPALILILAYQIYLFTFETVLSSSALSWIPSYKQVATYNRLFTFFCVASLLAFVLHTTFKASAILARQRARMILFGVTIAFLPSVIITLLVFFFKVTFPWNFLVFFVIFFPASIAYSIVKHNLFDADEIIKRTVGYVVVTVIVVGAYAGVSLALNVFVGKYQLAESRAFPILFTLGVILIFNPLRNRIQMLVDRVFFRKEYDYGEIIERIGGAMTSLLDLGQILKCLTQTFIEDMFINTSSVMLLNPAGTEYQVYLADGERKQDVEGKALKRDEALIKIIEAEKRELTKYDVLEDPKYKVVSKMGAANFDALHASLMVPLVYQGQVIGSLNLGEKKSGKFYNRGDIDLLHTLANQGAVAIENARLLEEVIEKERMEEELSIAHDLQTSMLPATCPEVEGFKLAAVSTSAREVGGDFFDFIEMGEGKLGLVIGDVTGKSVSGALVMSASRSVFRMLSEENLAVGEIMIRANRRMNKDVKKGMFVALLYAVLDSEDRLLSLCSAGQTQPIHFSAKKGEVRLVETEGDTFPLGILEDVEYKETRVQLAFGDKVVFYTDGIVEAMNQQEEMFGFERLLGVVQGSRAMTADSLLKEIVDGVNSFASGAAQHDDLTVIVVSVDK
jgi:sigma-B regulation protein RsbU (phosphoserine phosphatase)